RTIFRQGPASYSHSMASLDGEKSLTYFLLRRIQGKTAHQIHGFPDLFSAHKEKPLRKTLPFGGHQASPDGERLLLSSAYHKKRPSCPQAQLLNLAGI